MAWNNSVALSDAIPLGIRPFRLSALLMMSAVTIASHGAIAGTYTSVAPYSATGTSTGVNGINDLGYITGVVGNPDGSSDGFIRSPGGAYTLFQVPGANGFNTYGRAISNGNVITGYSTDSSGVLQTDTEFARSASGVLTILTNFTTSAPLHGIAGGMNAAGAQVGDYFFTSGGLNYRHGYIVSGSTFTDVSASTLNTDKTQARDINDSGVIVGFVRNALTGTSQGFVDTGGVFQFVNNPDPLNASITYLESINNNGIASGEFADASGTLHPFLYNTLTDAFTTLMPPVADSYFAFGINNLGDVVLSGQTLGNNYIYAPVMGGVPEPESWALMLVGFSSVGAVIRSARRKRVLVAEGLCAISCR